MASSVQRPVIGAAAREQSSATVCHAGGISQDPTLTLAFNLVRIGHGPDSMELIAIDRDTRADAAAISPRRDAGPTPLHLPPGPVPVAQLQMRLLPAG